MSTKTSNQRPTSNSGSRPKPSTTSRNRLVWTGVFIVAAVLGLLAVFLSSGGNDSKAASSTAGAYKFQVGQPGPGQQAPQVRLAATDGTTFDLASLHGQKVLLYFQEGIGCQPCWDQIKDIEKTKTAFHGLGIDHIVSITTNDLTALRQKVSDEGITVPVASDPNLAVSRAYHANQYGMMGDSTDGHSFVLVGPDGKILWRADYGGSPDFTMYVPPTNLIADLQKGLGASTTAGT